MDLLGYQFTIGNRLGLYSLISLLLLLLLYFVRPKPFKKVIPSLIFLEASEKRVSLTSFFRKFVKDWLMLLQLFILLMLCFAAMDVTAELYMKRFSREVVFVIDASASSQAKYEGKMLFDSYKDLAKKDIGIINSIILVKSTPEILAKQINPVQAYTMLSTMAPSDSLSNIWDAMMISPELADLGATIVVLSDFSDTGRKDLSTAMKILEAKGYNIKLIDPVKGTLSNIGIISFTIEKGSAIIQIKNFDDIAREIKIKGGSSLTIKPLSVEKVSFGLKEGLNTFEIETGDDFNIDDKLEILIPKGASQEALFITNIKKSYIRSAFESIAAIKVKRAEPPIVNFNNEKIIILDGTNYGSMLPGTVDTIRSMVNYGSILIITVQDNIDSSKLGDLIPVELKSLKKEDAEILNTGLSDTFKDYGFGMSSRYYESVLKNDSSLIIAEVNDKFKSPAIVLTRYGQGAILYYGIFDDYNPFKTSTQYPLFWIKIIETALSKEDYNKLNYKIGDILYSETIKFPSGKTMDNYAVADSRGIYSLSTGPVAVNLLNAEESDLNFGYEEQAESVLEASKIKQPISLLMPFIIFSIFLVIFEVYFLKKRGDL